MKVAKCDHQFIMNHQDTIGERVGVCGVVVVCVSCAEPGNLKNYWIEVVKNDMLSSSKSSIRLPTTNHKCGGLRDNEGGKRVVVPNTKNEENNHARLFEDATSGS